MAVRHRKSRDGDLGEAASAPMRRPTAGERFGPILNLQQQAGNSAVSRLVVQRSAGHTDEADEGEPDTDGMSFDVTIPKSDHDGPQGAEHDAEVNPDQVTAALTSGLAEAEEVPEGGEVRLPDMTMPDVQPGETDAISPSLTFSATIENSGAFDAFGATSWATFNLTDITVKKKKASYAASFKVKNPIIYNVNSGGNTDIASATDASLTDANYATAASDLMPNMADLGGRPPRTQFWARDLTLRHERFHSRERKRLNGAGAKQAKTWLAGQVATSVGGVQTLIGQVPAKIIASSQAAVGTLAQKEARAYGDGVSSYKSRSKAITKRGAAGKYP